MPKKCEMCGKEAVGFIEVEYKSGKVKEFFCEECILFNELIKKEKGIK